MACNACSDFMGMVKDDRVGPCGRCLQPIGLHRTRHPHRIHETRNSPISSCEGFMLVPEVSPLKKLNAQEALRRMVV